MLRRWCAWSLFCVTLLVLAIGCGASNDDAATDGAGPDDRGSCAAGLTECGGDCVDFSISPQHCGACGRGCQSDEACIGGTCESMEECGNGEVEGAEQCDDGAATANCDLDCTQVICGDSVVNTAAGEDCDDGASSATCDVDCTAVECGDGIVNAEAGEVCENGMMETAACDVDCTAAECGDGVLNETAGETCDDGAESATCDADCTVAECGDGVVNALASEECDDAGESPTCDIDCTAPACGDGVPNAAAGEECDDGNNTSNDGCSAGCMNEFPPVCTTSSVGVQSGADWVVCEVNQNGAWISHTGASGGVYNPLQACQSIGFNAVGQSGGTCGDVCGYCTSATTSCMSPGPKNFTGGGTSCGANLLCYTVMWECLP